MTKLRIESIKLLDALFGFLICKFYKQKGPNRSIIDTNRFKKLLLIRPGGIGDAVLLLPAILSLKKEFADAEIDVLAEKRNAAIFYLSTGVNKVYSYDKPKDLFQAIKGNYDAVIDTEQWHRLSAVVARLTGASIRIGYSTNERKKMFTHAIAYSDEDYEETSFFNLLTAFFVKKPADRKTALSIPREVSEKVKPMLQSLLPRKIVSLFPGGSIKEKRWGGDKFGETAKNLVSSGYSVVIVGGKEDVAEGHAIKTELSGVVNLCGKLSLLETAAVLQQVDLLITGDSGLLHIANVLGKKIVALFGPGNVKKWAPRGGHVAIITKNPECSPCSKFGYTPRCKNNVACMKNITVAEVYGKSIELLEK